MISQFRMRCNISLPEFSAQSWRISMESSGRLKPAPHPIFQATGRFHRIPHEMQYQLAGIQRAKLADFDGIVRALEKLGVARVSTRDEGSERVETRSTPKDDRKSLMILPFEDLS